MYYLTTNKNEIEYYKEKSDLLLKKAKPLMEIYRESNIKEYHLFLKKDENIVCDRTRYISSLPLFTISDELLIKYSYLHFLYFVIRIYIFVLFLDIYDDLLLI